MTLLRRRYCDIAAMSQGHLDSDFGKSRGDVGANPSRNLAIAISLRYHLRVATAMSPQYCHGDVAMSI